jgi:eukaryotic-like serine/threonine-protein kinase
MALTPGNRLGPYEILAAIGAGGMGEVYRARDPKLGRDVAIKVLPEAFARDADRMARFQREAKVLASLDHPNIASIYGLEDSSGTRALVMQLVEGPTLADRIKAGPIPADEAVRIARQIADALEYAHERGIIHRDLKPSNIKLTADDTVKILDFGLAKALEGDASSIDIATSPTISRMATQTGVLLGTAAYMSPEQAKAKPVDRRADIWAFGCVLYEMLTGQMAFRGESVTDTLASVIKEELDWNPLPAATPVRVRVLLQRCLQKDPKQRLRDIGDARISLDEALAGAPDPLSVVREKPAAPAEQMRFTILLPEKATLGVSGVFALSPDGRQLAFAASGPDGVPRLWIRSLDLLEARPLRGSESQAFPPFFWSPDSRYIVFDAGGKLKKIDISGGPAQTLCDIAGLAVGGSWDRDGVIIFGTSNGGLMRVPANGGSASPLTTLDPSGDEIRHVVPSFLPDGRHYIYLRQSANPGNSGAYIGSLDARPEQQDSKQLLATAYGPAYVPSSDAGSGRLLFRSDGTLMAQPFDAGRLELSGEPAAVAEHLGSFLDFGFFSASTNGVLVYRTGQGGHSQLTWFDQRGKSLGTVGEPSAYITLSLSPDGTRAAVTRVDPMPSLWLVDFSRGTSTRFTFGPSGAGFGTWSPDGSRIIFSGNLTAGLTTVTDLYQKLASGVKGEELLLKSSESKYPTSWSRDGRFLLYGTPDPKTKKRELWVLPVEGDKKPFPFLQTEFNNDQGQFSPDGRWVAYTSDESGRSEIYVRTFSPDSTAAASETGGKWLISTGGGVEPRWRGDGKALYYLAPDRNVMAIEIATDPVFLAGAPKALFQSPPSTVSTRLRSWELAPDGKRFLFAVPTEQGQTPFTVALNWQSGLKK